MGQGSKPVYITYLTYKLSYWWGEDEENEYHIESGRYVKLSLRFLWNTKSSSTGRALTDAHVLMSPGPCRFWSLHTSLLSKPSSCHKLALFPCDIDTTGRTLLDIGDIVWAPPLLWTHSYLRVYSLGQLLSCGFAHGFLPHFSLFQSPCVQAVTETWSLWSDCASLDPCLLLSAASRIIATLRGGWITSILNCPFSRV